VPNYSLQKIFVFPGFQSAFVFFLIFVFMLIYQIQKYLQIIIIDQFMNYFLI